MSFEAGRQIWIPCEVEPGPFSDERMIRVNSSRGEWVGFVHVGTLREPILAGETFVRAVIVKVDEGGTFNARIPGEAVTTKVMGNERELTSSTKSWKAYSRASASPRSGATNDVTAVNGLASST